MSNIKQGIQSFSSFFRFPSRRFGFLVQFLVITSAIAASAGVGFGVAIRFNHSPQPGSTLLNPEQSFPPRQDWPVSNEQ